MDDRCLFRYGPEFFSQEFRTDLDWTDWTGSGGRISGRGKAGSAFMTGWQPICRGTRPCRDTKEIAQKIPQIAVFTGCFQRDFAPDNLRAMLAVIYTANVPVHVAAAPEGERPLYCGRTVLSCGLVDEACAEAQRLVDALLPFAEQGRSIFPLDPSWLLTLGDEIPALLPDQETDLLAKHARMLEEYIADQSENTDFHLPLKSPGPHVLVHRQCHRKAMGVMSSIKKHSR